MPKTELTPRQVLGFIIAGIRNKRYQAVLNLAQDCLEQMDAQAKHNPPLEPTNTTEPLPK